MDVNAASTLPFHWQMCGELNSSREMLNDPGSLPLRCGPGDPARATDGTRQLQLLLVPPHRRALGLLPADQVAVHDPDGRLAGYVQGDATLTTWHCVQCACTTHWSAFDPAYERMGVNLRLFDPAVWEPLPRRLIDGASW